MRGILFLSYLQLEDDRMLRLLRLREQHSLDSENYYSYDEVIPKWKFFELYSASNDTDIQIIKELYAAGENIERLVRHKINGRVYLIGQKIIIIYTNYKVYQVYRKNSYNSQLLLDDIIETAEIADGLQLENSYDFTNNNVVFDKNAIDIRKFLYMCRIIRNMDKQVVRFEDGCEYQLKYTGEECFIDGNVIPLSDIVVFEFLADTRTNLYALKEFYLGETTFISTGTYLIKINSGAVDYMSLKEESSDMLSFITTTENKDSHDTYINEEKFRKNNSNNKQIHGTRLHRGLRKEKQEASTTFKCKLNDLRKKMLFLIKKPTD